MGISPTASGMGMRREWGRAYLGASGTTRDGRSGGRSGPGREDTSPASRTFRGAVARSMRAGSGETRLVRRAPSPEEAGGPVVTATARFPGVAGADLRASAGSSLPSTVQRSRDTWGCSTERKTCMRCMPVRVPVRNVTSRVPSPPGRWSRARHWPQCSRRSPGLASPAAGCRWGWRSRTNAESRPGSPCSQSGTPAPQHTAPKWQNLRPAPRPAPFRQAQAQGIGLPNPADAHTLCHGTQGKTRTPRGNEIPQREVHYRHTHTFPPLSSTQACALRSVKCLMGNQVVPHRKGEGRVGAEGTRPRGADQRPGMANRGVRDTRWPSSPSGAPVAHGVPVSPDLACRVGPVPCAGDRQERDPNLPRMCAARASEAELDWAGDECRRMLGTRRSEKGHASAVGPGCAPPACGIRAGRT